MLEHQDSLVEKAHRSMKRVAKEHCPKYYSEQLKELYKTGKSVRMENFYAALY